MNTTYNGTQMLEIMTDAAFAIRQNKRNITRQFIDEEDINTATALLAQREARDWVLREFERYPVHPVIEAAIKLVRPINWQQLLLEHPHTSQGDKSKIAYTQNEDKGRRDIQTVTSVGKYLTRHFDLPDHTIRDLVSRYGSAARFKLVHTTAEMIYHLHKGPKSCMVWDDDRGVGCRDGVTRHPYEAYNPKYGWHMAVRIEGDDTMGRALCMTNPETGFKYFVRSYLRPSNESSYSQTDDGMNTWLQEQGYAKEHSWQDGEKLAYHETRDDFLAPYLDGGDKKVSVVGGGMYLVVDSDGEYACDQTGGAPTEMRDDTFECADCGDDTDDDDGYWVGYNDDSHVCGGCYENDYVHGYGRNGRQYSFRSDDATYVESQSEYYHDHYLGDNNIVELENGEYEHIDNAIEVDGDWYHIDDERICRTEDTDEYLLCDEGCWQCTESGNWYSDSVDFVEVDNCKYHPDRAPATDDGDDSDGNTAVAVDTVVPKQSTLLTMEMLNLTHMLWDYSISMNEVTVSLTYTHDGHKLYAQRVFTQEFVNGVDRTQFNRILRNQLCTELMAQAAHNAHLETI
jgi:hypothetical protein